MDLDDLLAETFTHESGALLPISAACLDTGGTAGHTQRAYDYAKGKTGRRLFAIKGQGGWGLPVVQSPQRKKSGKKSRKVDLFMVGADEAKLIIMRRLGKQEPGPGYCHFPVSDNYDESHFNQLTAEKLVTRYIKGQPKREWTKPDKARNEALDCRVYAFAALKIMNPSLKRLAERRKLNQPTRDSVMNKESEKPTQAGQGPEKPQVDENTPEPETADNNRRNKRTLKTGGRRKWSATKW
jgi:phage terminase large subunit GpA-like protein